ncbi:unnamed protein product [Penicillium manginii]
MFEELSHTNAHLNHTAEKVTRFAENITDLYEELSHQRELTPQALCEMSRIREQLEILRNHISAYASEGAQARAPLSRGNTSLVDWAASVMPRRPSSVRTEDSRDGPYPQSNLRNSTSFWPGREVEKGKNLRIKYSLIFHNLESLDSE